MPSHIQSLAIEDLARVWPGQVHCIWATPISKDRAALSWLAPHMPNTSQQYIDQSNPGEFADDVIRRAHDSIHLFSGLSSYPAITTAFFCARRQAAKNLGLMVEPGIELGLRGWLRPLRARFLAQRYLGSTRLVLAMGQTGVRFYRRAGFRDGIIFPYMYQAPVGSNQAQRRTSDTFNLVYVGKFSRRKGLDILLRALTFCRTKALKLKVIGGGREERQLRKLSRRLGLDASVCWLGVRDHEQILAALAESDVCVVPSRFEGWGVVVNEAIGMGTPVICSNTTTSRDLVRYGDCGRIFRSGDSRDLAKQIDQLLGDPEALAGASENASNYRRLLTPRVVAEYLKQVLEFSFLESQQRPSPPWAQPKLVK